MQGRARKRRGKLSRDQLEEARGHFKGQLRRPGDEQDGLAAMHRRRKRLICYALVVVVIVALVGNWLHTRNEVEPEPVHIQIVHGPPVPDFGDDAVLPPGTRAIADARLAGLEGLASGSYLAQETQLALSKERQWPIEIENSIGMRFRLIPHGSFVIGSSEKSPLRAPDEAPRVATVQLPIYMGKYEVTQAQWEAVMGEGTNPSKQKGPNHPVEDLTWHQAREFMAKLCELEGVPRWSYRLPYEAEWEHACRAGTQTAWYSGDSPHDLGQFALFYWNVTDGSEPVGRRRPNAWGLYNMHGNVWEWCIEQFYYYEDLDTKDEKQRVIRGGNWRLQPEDCRSASRYRLPPDSHSNLLGFRVVRSISRPLPPIFHGTEAEQDVYRQRHLQQRRDEAERALPPE